MRTVSVSPARPHVADYLRALSGMGERTEREWVLSHVREAVPGAHTGSDDHDALAAFEGAAELRGQIARRLVLGRIEGAARIGFRSGVPFVVDPASTAAWVSETSGKPATPFKAALVSLPPRTVAAITVVTRSLLQGGNPRNRAAILRLLAAGCAARANATFLGTADAVAGEAPASLGSVATAVDEGASVAATLEAIVQAADDADVDLASAVWVLAPPMAVAAASSLGTDTVGLRGGTLLGAPAITDRAAGDRIFLVAADRLAYALGGVSLEAAAHASVELDDAPDQSSGEPTATNLISLFQANSVGFLAELAINWSVVGSGVFASGIPSES